MLLIRILHSLKVWSGLKKAERQKMLLDYNLLRLLNLAFKVQVFNNPPFSSHQWTILRLHKSTLFQIQLGKIKLSANMESNGIIASSMFFSNSSTNGQWSEVLVSACSDDDTIAQDVWWKVRSGVNFINVFRHSFYARRS